MKRIRFLFPAVGVLVVLVSFLMLVEIMNLKGVIADEKSRLLATMSYLLMFFGAVVVILNFTSGKAEEISGNSDLSLDNENDETVDSIEDETVERKDDTKFERQVKSAISDADTLEKLCNSFLSSVCSEYSLTQGVLFTRKKGTDEFYVGGTYAYYAENTDYSFKIGEGISGQVAKNKKAISLTNIPEGYISIVSGLGDSSPNFLSVVPIIDSGETIAVVELASFAPFEKGINDLEKGVLKQLSKRLSEFI